MTYNGDWSQLWKMSEVNTRLQKMDEDDYLLEINRLAPSPLSNVVPSQNGVLLKNPFQGDHSIYIHIYTYLKYIIYIYNICIKIRSDPLG